LTQAIEFDFEAPLAQHALSPANALDAVSIAAATRAVVVILIMVSPQTCPINELFNCLSVIQLVILSEAKNLGSFLSRRRHNNKQRCFASFNMTRHGPELELQPARLPLQ